MQRRGFIKNSLVAAFPLVLPFPLGDFLSSPDTVRNIIFIQLTGGNDGYNTLVPYTREEYYLQRPSLAIPKTDVIPLTETHGLNPALSLLSKYYKNGELTFVNYVGMGQAEPSHFTATEIWNDAFSFNKEIKPGDFRDQLGSIASSIRDGKNGNYSLSLDGFDTHQFQRTKHDTLLKEYAEGLDSFIKYLKKDNKFYDTLIITWSEFGRQLRQNNRKGTDHGNENIVIAAGGSLKSKGILNASGKTLITPDAVPDLLFNNLI